MSRWEHGLLAFLNNAVDAGKVLYIYRPGQVCSPKVVSCAELSCEAAEGARRLQALPNWQHGRVCLVHLDDHYSNIRWFWSVIIAGGTPAMYAPLRAEGNESNIHHLTQLLSGPLFITTKKIAQTDLAAFGTLQSYAVDSGERFCNASPGAPASDAPGNATASSTILMFTSGSSGNAKAVPLSFAQILSCLEGKASALVCDDKPGTSVLNWVSMDHVAGLVEGHLRALFCGVDQVHVAAADIIASPGVLFELLGRHRVATTFAPNFLLARVVDGVASGELRLPSAGLDCLRAIASGGEACSTEVCRRFAELLRGCGARDGVVVPGFGMTETGAGCIFNRACPASDLSSGYEFTSVGRCVPGVEMRIVSLETDIDAREMVVQAGGDIGNLEIRGPLVFQGYYNNPKATAECFTRDGWFRTGDMGFIDRGGNLVLTGRSKDVISVNGVKHPLADQERVIDELKIPGVTPGYVVCFAWRPVGVATERCCIVYEHSYSVGDEESRLKAQISISKAVLLHIGTRPHVLPLPPGVLHKSSLGKLSRAKISQDFQRGHFVEYDTLNADMINATKGVVVRPANDTERVLLNVFSSVLGLSSSEMSTEAPFLNAGVTSVEMIRIRSAICRHFDLPVLGIGTMMTHDTIKSLARAINQTTGFGPHEPYQPVVRLKAEGSRSPLWLIHPGVGEVLVFMGLARHIHDRPVFALRARGFESGEEPFTSIDEVVTTYTEAICAQQPRGPYALAGYSYGSMLAFEIAKRIELRGERVDFLGCFNLPPHIKSRMRQMNRTHCLLHLAQFLELLREDQVKDLEGATIGIPFDEAMDLALASADQARWQELDLTRGGLKRWASVAFSLQSLAADYEPSGTVQAMDVFYCDPLAFAAKSKQEWLDVHLSKWKTFCRSKPCYHAVAGAHYTMLSPANVQTFRKTLESVLLDRKM